jgi:hypothetical protein
MARTDPARYCRPITPSDTDALGYTCRSVRCTGAGNVTGYLAGEPTTLRTCAFTAGESRALEFFHIRATSTTATGLEGMY